MLLFTSVRRRPGEVGGDREHPLYLQEVPAALSHTAARRCAQARGPASPQSTPGDASRGTESFVATSRSQGTMLKSYVGFVFEETKEFFRSWTQ